MKFCLKYSNKCSRLDRANEISIKYNEDLGLLRFLQNHSLQRIILRIETKTFDEDAEIPKLWQIRKQAPEYKFAAALDQYDESLANAFRAADIDFYVATPCKDWEEFHYLVSAGVSDIDISGPLGFELTKVKFALLSINRKIQIRATANMVNKLQSFTPTYLGFFIRPEDVPEYEGLIDVLEFEAVERQDVYYQFYAEGVPFLGDLSNCIYGLNTPIDNKGLNSLFGERRRDCGRQCLQGKSCSRCQTLFSLAQEIGKEVMERIIETVEKINDNVET